MLGIGLIIKMQKKKVIVISDIIIDIQTFSLKFLSITKGSIELYFTLLRMLLRLIKMTQPAGENYVHS